MSWFEVVSSLGLGLGLAASCGFRVFLPCLMVALGQRWGVGVLEDMPAWMGSDAGLALLGVATLGEIGAYYIPWVDNVLDSIASPAAVLAGSLLFYSVAIDLDPMWRWSLAAVAGGGAAGTTQAATVVTRGLSTASSGGALNPVVSTVEALLALLVTVAAVLAPPLMIIALGFSVWWLVRLLARRAQQRNHQA